MDANTVNLLYGLFGMAMGALTVLMVQWTLKLGKMRTRKSKARLKKTLILGRLLFRLRRVFLVLIITSTMAALFHEDLAGFIGLFAFLSVFVIVEQKLRRDC